MGEEDDAKINSLFNILNDLAKGQKFMMDLMGQLAKNSLEGPMKQNHNGDGVGYIVINVNSRCDDLLLMMNYHR
jgi:hypothetical protein